jgi:hypothetical protein
LEEKEKRNHKIQKQKMPKILVKIILIFIPFISLSQEVKIEHLTKNINTVGAELNFVQTNENTAFYTSSTLEEGEYQSLIFRTKLENGEWKKGRYDYLGKAYSYANISYLKEERYIYYSVIDKFGNSKIAIRDYKKPVTQFLNNKINLPYSVNTQAHKTAYNGKSVLYFVSDRKGGFGGMDIWFSVVDKFGNYGEPINAGERVNTKHNEITPFYNLWRGELFYSSDRDLKENGIDIYKASGSLNLWHKSEKVKELNSKEDDLYLSFYDEYSGYFSSNRSPSLFENEENCCNDIFSFQYLKKDTLILTFNDTIKKHLPIKLYFHNDEPDPRTTKTTTSKTYKDSYVSYYILKEEYLKGNPNIEIENFFELTLKGNYNKLNSTLSYVLQSLKNGGKMELHIKGFASPLHEKQYNINLSKRRISSFINLINTFENGELKSYLEIGNLKIIEFPYGEKQSQKNVSDNPKDRKKSVYSKESMLERKIEIVEIIEL